MMALYRFHRERQQLGSDSTESIADLSYRGGMIVELQGNSWSVSLEGATSRTSTTGTAMPTSS